MGAFALCPWSGPACAGVRIFCSGRRSCLAPQSQPNLTNKASAEQFRTLDRPLQFLQALGGQESFQAPGQALVDAEDPSCYRETRLKHLGQPGAMIFRRGDPAGGHLMARLRAGEAEALRVLYERHARRVCGFAHCFLVSPATAESATPTTLRERRHHTHAERLGIGSKLLIDRKDRRGRHLEGKEGRGCQVDCIEGSDGFQGEGLRGAGQHGVGHAVEMPVGNGGRVAGPGGLPDLRLHHRSSTTRWRVPATSVEVRLDVTTTWALASTFWGTGASAVSRRQPSTALDSA